MTAKRLQFRFIEEVRVVQRSNRNAGLLQCNVQDRDATVICVNPFGHVDECSELLTKIAARKMAIHAFNADLIVSANKLAQSQPPGVQGSQRRAGRYIHYEWGILSFEDRQPHGDIVSVAVIEGEDRIPARVG